MRCEERSLARAHTHAHAHTNVYSAPRLLYHYYNYYFYYLLIASFRPLSFARAACNVFSMKPTSYTLSVSEYDALLAKLGYVTPRATE